MAQKANYKYEYFDSKIPFIILENQDAEKQYLLNHGSNYMTFTPVRLAIFRQNQISNIYIVENTIDDKTIRNIVIRFTINYLISSGGLFFHASGGIINNKAYLMTGFSDIGKSTALELMTPDKVLSDDMIGCQYLEDTPHFYSTPFGRVVTENTHAQAKAVFFLVQSDKFRVEKLNPSQAVARYVGIHQKYILSLFGDLRAKAFQSARKFFSQIPSYELYFTKDYIDQDAISKILDGDESNVGNNPMSEIDWELATITRRKKMDEGEE